VAATRAASDQELLAGGRARLAQMLASGTTTAEAKSGYGLDVATELRLLELIARLGREGPIELVPTFLGAHAVPAEFRAGPAAAGPASARPAGGPDGTDAYVVNVIDYQLPAVARQGIARFCDVFCEQGVFSADQSRRILRAAADNGLALRLHADELARRAAPSLPPSWPRTRAPALPRGAAASPPITSGRHRRRELRRWPGPPTRALPWLRRCSPPRAGSWAGTISPRPAGSSTPGFPWPSPRT